MLQRRKDITDIVIHCSATKYGRWIDRDDIQEWHNDRHFPTYWDGGKIWNIGYHLIILTDGTLEFARPFESVGAHVAGQNFGSIGICMIGGLGSDGHPLEDRFSVMQYDCLHEVLWSCRAPYNDLYLPNLLRIKGHRDYSPDMNGDGLITRNEWLKDCPCFNVDEFLSRNGLAQYRIPAYIDARSIIT